MRTKQKNETIKRYNELLSKYGATPSAIGWRKCRYNTRFNAQSKIGDLNNCSILDVGCGFGYLYRFLKQQGLDIDYTGYDINPNFIAVAKQKYPDVCFEVKDIEKDDVHNKYDWVFATGIFNSKRFLYDSFVENMIIRMFELSKNGISVDFISTYVDYRNDKINYVNPEKMFSFCKTISRYVVLKHDYMPSEFCLYIYKRYEV